MPFALIALVLVPAVAGALRLAQLSGGTVAMPADPRMAASPWPVSVHIVAAIAYAVVGAFQFSPSLRRRRPRRHRRVGRALVPLGLAVAFSALWMTLFHARTPGSGQLLFGLRLLFGAGMAMALVLGFAAIRRGDVPSHRAWMMRAYALALGAGTQVFTQGIGYSLFGRSELATALMMGAGWAINLLAAEVLIRSRRGKRFGGALAKEAFQ
ncbi:DUF2306 domain-containing protein [Paeniglutamicibacter psychrophenolicus]